MAIRTNAKMMSGRIVEPVKARPVCFETVVTGADAPLLTDPLPTLVIGRLSDSPSTDGEIVVVVTTAAAIATVVVVDFTVVVVTPGSVVVVWPGGHVVVVVLGGTVVVVE